MKYVMLRDRVNGFVTPVFTCAPITHADLARAFRESHEPVSAGFVEFFEGGAVRVGGRSTSLNLGPSTGDARIIAASVKATLAMAKHMELPPAA